MKITLLNETVALWDFSSIPASDALAKSHQFAAWVRSFDDIRIEDVWCGFESVAIKFDPARITFETLKKLLSKGLTERDTKVPGKHHEIEVKYDPGSEDMKAVAKTLNMPVAEIIKLHHSPTYQVALMGFLPGFPYLNGLPKELHIPRKSVPAISVAPGSVAIGGSHSCIYPFKSPGGWHVLGHTAISLFSKPDSFLLRPGDQIKFVAI